MKSKFFKLILKSSKIVLAELSEKQIDDLFDINYLKENAPEEAYDGQFTDISGKVWNYSDVEKMYYISPNEYVHLDEIYQILLSMDLAQNIQLKKFCIPNITKNKKKKYFVTYNLTYHDDNVVKPIFTLSDMIEACNAGFQRHGCLCCSAKTELLRKKERCPYQCMYCYWKEKSTKY